MIPNVTKSDRMAGLIRYLAGPGRDGGHRDQRIAAASIHVVSVEVGQLFDTESARALGRELDLPKAVFGASRDGRYVYHCSLTLPSGEGPLSDELWEQIANGFAEKMGFNDSDETMPCRWAAIHHGATRAGRDHLHFVASMVREDGTRWRQSFDFRLAQKVCDELEREHGLRVVRGVARP